jgi:Fe2+ transport system protein B
MKTLEEVISTHNEIVFEINNKLSKEQLVLNSEKEEKVEEEMSNTVNTNKQDIAKLVGTITGYILGRVLVYLLGLGILWVNLWVLTQLGWLPFQ